jgi:hypothetical protein
MAEPVKVYVTGQGGAKVQVTTKNVNIIKVEEAKPKEIAEMSQKQGS